jgi:hypothetical protein
MAGTLVLDTLQNGAGTYSTSADNVIRGSAKAWVAYSGSTQSIFTSFNVSSVTFNSVGSYTVNMTTAMPNANYAIFCTSQAGPSNVISCYVNNSNAKTTTAFSVLNYFGTGPSGFDVTTYMAVFSN